MSESYDFHKVSANISLHDSVYSLGIVKVIFFLVLTRFWRSIFKRKYLEQFKDVGPWTCFENLKTVPRKWVVFLSLTAQDNRQESACQVPDGAGVCHLHVLSQLLRPWHSSWSWWVYYFVNFFANFCIWCGSVDGEAPKPVPRWMTVSSTQHDITSRLVGGAFPVSQQPLPKWPFRGLIVTVYAQPIAQPYY